MKPIEPYLAFKLKVERDWLKDTNVEQLLFERFDHYSSWTWRQFLYAYLSRYHDTYLFDCLEEPFILVGELLDDPDNATILHHELAAVKRDMPYLKGEQHWSLSALAEALEPLLYDAPLTPVSVCKSLNLVLFAYSCQLPEHQFLKREVQLLFDWVMQMEKK